MEGESPGAVTWGKGHVGCIHPNTGGPGIENQEGQIFKRKMKLDNILVWYNARAYMQKTR